MVLIGNEVGVNIEMTGDGHIWGDRLLCEESFIAQIKSPIKAEHFTDIGL